MKMLFHPENLISRVPEKFLQNAVLRQLEEAKKFLSDSRRLFPDVSLNMEGISDRFWETACKDALV